MRRVKATMITMAVLVLVLATSAMAAAPTVDAVLAIEYNNGVFAAAVLAHGPEPLALARLLVNEVEVGPDRAEHIVLGPKQNVTLFKFTKQGAVVEPDDQVTAEVTDMTGTMAEKTVT